jgi:hypothetical protein
VSLAGDGGALLGQLRETAGETAQGVARVRGGRGARHAGQLGGSVEQVSRGKIAERHLNILLLQLEN